MMVLMDICASLYLGRKSSNEADKKELLWLFPFTLVGMVIGITLLINARSEPLRKGSLRALINKVIPITIPTKVNGKSQSNSFLSASLEDFLPK